MYVLALQFPARFSNKSCFSWIKCWLVSLWTITIDSHGALYQLMHFRHNKRGFTFQIKSYIASNSHSSFDSTLPFYAIYVSLPIFQWEKFFILALGY